MEYALELLSNSLSFENGLSTELANKIVCWLDTESVLDYQLLNEIYSEPVAA